MLVLKEKPAKMLMALLGGSKYLSQVAREIGATYVHVKHLADVFLAKGIIQTERKGKMVYASLTEKGERMARLVESIAEIEGNGKEGKE